MAHSKRSVRLKISSIANLDITAALSLEVQRPNRKHIAKIAKRNLTWGY